MGRITILAGLFVCNPHGAIAAVVSPTISTATVRVVRVRYQPVAACQGVDDTINPVAIMAPIGGTNNVQATIAPTTQATRVHFDSANTAVATVSPTAATASPQALQIGGVSQAETTIRARTTTSGVLRPLTASAKPRLNRTIAIHAITEQNDDVQVTPVGQGEANQICITAGPNGAINSAVAGDDVLVGTTSINSGPNGICESSVSGDDVQVIPVGHGRPNRPCVGAGPNGFRDSVPVGDDQVAGNDINSGADGICQTVANATNLVPTNVPSAAALQTYLNSVWGQQANVFFTVTRTDPAPINYDLDRNGILADPSLGSATSVEINAIAAGARTAGVDFNIYYINVMEIPQAFTLQVSGIPALLQNSTWIQSAHANSDVNVSAHEVGHLLGINYESPGTHDVMLNFGSATNPCEVRKLDWDTVNHP